MKYPTCSTYLGVPTKAMSMAIELLHGMFLLTLKNGARDKKKPSDFDQLAALAEQNMYLRDKNHKLMQMIRRIASRLPSEEKKESLRQLEEIKDEKND